MSRTPDYGRYYVLYVDDEQPALKYFKRSLDGDFRILTASSANEAWNLLTMHGEQVGVLVTDQRMPNETGLELMERAKVRWPGLARILVTAFSDLQTAIDAVNHGGAFRYITKPWQEGEIKGTLKRALDYYDLQQERQRLLREKLHVVQEMLVMDRTRSLLTLAASLTDRLPNSLAAVRSYIQQAPLRHGQITWSADFSAPDLADMNRSEAWRALRLARQLTAVFSRLFFEDGHAASAVGTDVAACVTKFVNDRGDSSRYHKLALRLPSHPRPICLASTPFELLLQTLFDSLHELNPAVEMTLEVSASSPVMGARLRLRMPDVTWTDMQMQELFADVTRPSQAGAGYKPRLLEAFLLASLGGGTIEVLPASPDGAGFDVLLPSKMSTKPAEADEQWIDDLYNEIEQRQFS
jgi:FixJ family two-component response regulator